MNKNFFITGSDTDVGKTTITALLLKQLTQKGFQVDAIKPIQTGCTVNETGTLVCPDILEYEKLLPGYKAPLPYRAYNIPASPHLASDLEGNEIILDEVLCYCNKFIEDDSISLIEGAGGIFTPLNHTHSYLDVMKELRIPIILVVDNKLGMINHTALSINVLELNGLSISKLIINNTSKITTEEQLLINKSNVEYLKEQFSHISITCVSYNQDEKISLVDDLIDILQEDKTTEQDFDNLLKIDSKNIWHPYSSFIQKENRCLIDRTKGNYLYTNDGTKLLDGMSSWWCAIHGYNTDRIRKAAIKQIATMPHVMFGGITHKPAIELTKKLLEILPANLNRIFYSDSGSVSVEVALKMAIQYWNGCNKSSKKKLLTVKGGYHGDTFGAMAVCDPENGMHSLYNTILPKHFFAEKPSIAFDEEFSEDSMKSVESLMMNHHREIAALIIEPIVQGAGGMWFYHPMYLRSLRALCDKYEILLICDEIATGFGRTGKLFAHQWSNITPDIMCIGKALTGGTLSFAATVTTEAISKGVSNNGGVLMHGPTFMANPLACSIALESLHMLLESPWKNRVNNIEETLKEELGVCKNNISVKNVRVLGAIGVVELMKPIDQEATQKFFINEGVWIRPFRNLVYIMPPYTIEKHELIKLCDSIKKFISMSNYKEKLL